MIIATAIVFLLAEDDTFVSVLGLVVFIEVCVGVVCGIDDVISALVVWGSEVEVVSASCPAPDILSALKVS
jgi:hypothetical protein